jgi:hypothetical protein
MSMQGTSMATPVAAGIATITRQYFTDGWYPSGKPVKANSFNPSGALLKAVLVNSAVPMRFYRRLDNTLIPLGLPPDNYQGFGRVKLDDALPLNGNGKGLVGLWLNDSASIATGG